MVDQSNSESARGTGARTTASAALPRAVIALGWVSLLTDAASDMIYPLIPAFLLSLGGGPLLLGWLEGIAELIGALLKIVSGRSSDRANTRKPLIALGYGISSIARPLYSIVASPLHAIAIRAFDRVGKGLRGPPRDAMIASLVPPEQRGHAFGFHRMMDNFGGVLGPILAFALLRLFELPLRTVFAVSLVPGVLSVLIVVLFVRDPSRRAVHHGGQAVSREEKAVEGKTSERLEAKPEVPSRVPTGARWYLASVFVFSLASSGDLFLVRRLTDVGLAVDFVPLAWISLQLAKGLMNVPGGRASDRYGRQRVLSIAWLLYGLSYAGFGLASHWATAWLWLALYALHYGLAEGGQRALLAEYVPGNARGRAYGYQLAIEGLMVLPANVLFGFIYERFGGELAFLCGGGIAMLAAAFLFWLVPAPEKRSARPEASAP